ncbi:hypothetical protein CJU89_6258 [Yarrowia sp. B02]|nr:hypothetical protein CJU89_6258 [Yarrowia sp. B02]
MNVDSEENPYTCGLVKPYPPEVPGEAADSSQKCSGGFASGRFQKLLDVQTQYLMAVPHRGPSLSDGERTHLERDLAAAVNQLKDPEPHDLLSAIQLFNAIEHVLTTLVMHNPTNYSMSQLWSIASRHMGDKLYKRNAVFIQQPHWIGMRRAATKEISGGSDSDMLSYNLFHDSKPEEFDSLLDFLVTLGWSNISKEEGNFMGIYQIMSKVGPILGNGGLFEDVQNALCAENPAGELERYRAKVQVLWSKAHVSQPKSKKRKK